ncbi:hypothetical protein ABWI00_12350 [Algihabitans albus]|uniref:hypothetical protein n=1 Tax=Algihabitans albus TaxID=2164067 RepID=UPI0035D00B1C
MTTRGAWAVLGLAGAILASGCTQSPASSAKVTYLTTERWCYRTLADVDCYTSPQKNAELRRVGWFDAVSVK